MTFRPTPCFLPPNISRTTASIKPDEAVGAREQARQDIQKAAAGDLDQEGESQLQQSVVTNILHHNLNTKTLEEEEQQMTK